MLDINMRAFIALEIPELVKKEIGKIQIQLEQAGIQARWVKPEISHLTLAFLGSITPDKIEVIGKILNEAVAKTDSIHLELHQLDCFPAPSRPRIIFVSLQGETDKLNDLALKIRKGLKKAGIYFDEKPFLNHITLGRIKRKQNLSHLIEEIQVKKVEFVANEVTLTQSTLTDSGPIYKILKSFFLPSPRKIG